MTALKLAFMGSPDFATPVLASLIDAGHEIACVYAQPPRPAGRGHKERPAPVHAYAAEIGIDVRTPANFKNLDDIQAFLDLELDAAVVVAYGLILPPALLSAPRLGCINVHASLLPRWRGAAPIQRAILADDEKTGVSIMAMDEGLDTGAVYAVEDVLIGAETTATTLHDELSALGAKMMPTVLADIDAGTLEARPQSVEGVIYANKLSRDESRIDWRAPAAQIERAVRALNPWPGVWFEYSGTDGPARIKVLDGNVVADAPAGSPGTVVAEPLVIACAADAFRVERLQRPGKGPMEAEPFLRGFPIAPGRRLD
ncbi:MAG: methionyl-tRNA formyltransferase [Rhodospirillaceae bacterium]|jgi:methionyl-tRNA formyltransferase|nr:methionyl-tRNA formyltransferase [Rhodospirillaceae bacterium]MBT5298930.1 methionyl-tRNA formyltransferase [Rhodospirillaceae bacterium]MBT6086846.1 methionyl-tRNA formyltransferase [Rhodospirillaceae bacterium]MBT7510354.1 methionyl-tRNA formyltransferase [Rhodospirillaceae bacterium]